MGQHKAKMGATMRQPGSNSNPARADGSALAGARLSGVSLINPARGPLAVALPYGSSLLSVGERGRAPCRRRVGTAKNPRVLRCFVLLAFLALFRLMWRKMGQPGPT